MNYLQLLSLHPMKKNWLFGIYGLIVENYKRKGKRSDSVLWQKALHPQKNPKSNLTTQKKTPPKTSELDYTTIADRLRLVSCE